MTADPASVHFKDGRLYVARPAYDRYFAECEAVILLRQDKDLLVLPVRHAASGGYMLKIRNVAGDRVVSAADFFRDQGLDDDTAWQGSYSWCERQGGLRLYELFLM